MTLPLMDPDATAVAQLPRSEQVTTSTCVHEALARLQAGGERATVVYASGRPVGVVTAAALARALESGRAGSPIGATMDYVAVPVDRRAGARDTIHTFTNAAWAWLRGRHG
jgi:hypothetical protein